MNCTKAFVLYHASIEPPIHIEEVLSPICEDLANITNISAIAPVLKQSFTAMVSEAHTRSYGGSVGVPVFLGTLALFVPSLYIMPRFYVQWNTNVLILLTMVALMNTVTCVVLYMGGRQSLNALDFAFCKHSTCEIFSTMALTEFKIAYNTILLLFSFLPAVLLSANVSCYTNCRNVAIFFMILSAGFTSTLGVFAWYFIMTIEQLHALNDTQKVASHLFGCSSLSYDYNSSLCDEIIGCDCSELHMTFEDVLTHVHNGLYVAYISTIAILVCIFTQAFFFVNRIR